MNRNFFITILLTKMESPQIDDIVNKMAEQKTKSLGTFTLKKCRTSQNRAKKVPM